MAGIALISLYRDRSIQQQQSLTNIQWVPCGSKMWKNALFERRLAYYWLLKSRWEPFLDGVAKIINEHRITAWTWPNFLRGLLRPIHSLEPKLLRNISTDFSFFLQIFSRDITEQAFGADCRSKKLDRERLIRFEDYVFVLLHYSTRSCFYKERLVPCLPSLFIELDSPFFFCKWVDFYEKEPIW